MLGEVEARALCMTLKFKLVHSILGTPCLLGVRFVHSCTAVLEQVWAFPTPVNRECNPAACNGVSYNLVGTVWGGTTYAYDGQMYTNKDVHIHIKEKKMHSTTKNWEQYTGS